MTETKQYNRLFSLMVEYTKKLNQLAARTADERQPIKLLMTAVKKLIQTASQRINLTDNYVIQIELEVRLAELEIAFATVSSRQSDSA